MIKLKDLLWETEEYRGHHKAPDKSYAPLHDMTQVYQDDIYSNMAARYYGHFGGNDINDKKMINIIHRYRNKPNDMVTIYRAVPNNLKETEIEINAGDWVTLSEDYAVGHGKSTLEGNYKILTKEVPARTLFNDGNSIFEFGYDPT